jgi:hypothetical protein
MSKSDKGEDVNFKVQAVFDEVRATKNIAIYAIESLARSQFHLKNHSLEQSRQHEVARAF